MRGVSVQSAEHRMTPAGGRVLRRDSDTSSASVRRRVRRTTRRTRRQVRSSSRRCPGLVVERRRERRQHASRRGRRTRGSRRTGASDSAAASARISSLNAIEPLGRQIRLVHHLERHAPFDERVIHAQHVIRGAVALRDAGMIRLGLVRLQQRHARERPLVAQIPLVRRRATGRCARRQAATGDRRARRRTS